MDACSPTTHHLTLVFGIWFLICYTVTQLVTQLQQRCIQVVYSSKEAPEAPDRIERHSRNGRRTHECCFEVLYMYVGRFKICRY